MEAHKTFVSDPKDIPDVLDQLRKSGIPEKFDKEFLSQIETEHNLSNLYIHLFKRLGLINDEQVPIKEYYSDFVESAEKSRSIVAKLLPSSYKEVFKHNEKAHQLSEEELEKVFQKLLGDSKSDMVINLSAQTFKGLTEYAYNNTETQELKEETSMSMDNISESNGSTEAGDNGQNYEELDTAQMHDSDNEKSETVNNGLLDEIDFTEAAKETEPDHTPQVQQSAENQNTEQSVSKSKFLKKALFRRAKLLDMMDNYQSAAKAYSAIIEYANKEGVQIEEEKLTEAFYKRALFLEQQGKYEEAVTLYDDFIKKWG